MSACQRSSPRGDRDRPSRCARRRRRGRQPDGDLELALRLGELGVVFEAAEQLLDASRRRERRARRRTGARGRRREIAGLQVDPRQPAQRVRLAALVAGLATHRQRALEAQAGLGHVAGLERDFAEHELAFALDLLVPDLAGDRQALLEVRSRAGVVALVQADLAEMQQADRFADAVVRGA